MNQRQIIYTVCWLCSVWLACSAWGGSVTMGDGSTQQGELLLAGGRIIFKNEGRERLIPLADARSLRFVDPDHPPVGLFVTCYSENNFTRAIEFRVEKTAEALIARDDPCHSMRWTGWLIVPVSGMYQFDVTTSDLATIWIDGKRVVNFKGPGRFTANVSLRAGERYPFKAEFLRGAGQATLQVQVQLPNELSREIPASWLLAGPMPPADQGVYAEYFTDPELTDRAGAAIIPTPSLVNRHPFANIGPYNFSVRYSAVLTPTQTDLYTFDVDVDDGVRMWIDDSLILDAWEKEAGQRSSKPIRLIEGRSYALRIEMMQLRGDAILKVDWSGKQVQRTVLAADLLRVPKANVGEIKPLAPPSQRDFSQPRLTQGVVLVDGSAYSGTPMALDAKECKLKRDDGTVISFSRGQVARILWQMLPYQAEIPAGRTGMVLRDGDFYEGDVKLIDDKGIVVESLLFGRRTFKPHERASAAILSEIRPSPLTWTIRSRDGSAFRSDTLRIIGGKAQFNDPRVGEMALGTDRLFTIQRNNPAETP